MSQGLARHSSQLTSKQRLAIGAVVLVLATLLMAGRQPESALAHNDYCTQQSSGQWYCVWSDPSQAPETPHWFTAAVTLRHWIYAAVRDGHGGSVTAKCVHVMRGSDGYVEQVACGSGIKDNYTNTYMRPGYLFTRHGANGARSIGGDGAH